MGETRFVRANRGDVIHERSCRYAANGLPWIWAEGRAVLDVAASAVYTGLRSCRLCQPFREVFDAREVRDA